MKHGVYVPNFGEYADPERLLSLARSTEESGWDGFFLYDHLVDDAYGMAPGDPIADPWILLAAIAASTRRIRLGPMVTPVARRRPAKLAREIASLDHLSAGRLIFGAGLGGAAAFAPFGEDAAPEARAQRLDEGLEIVASLLRGEPVSHHGPHHRLRQATFLPAQLQRPRVPVWIAGIWPFPRPFARAARWDGVFPLSRDHPVLTPNEIREVADCVRSHRGDDSPFDLVAAGATTAGADEHVRACEKAGATWWFEWLEPARGSIDEMRDRVLAGPPA